MIPVQLQRLAMEVLDQLERWFMGSSMESLNMRRLSASDDEAELRMKKEKLRERKSECM